MMTAKDLRRVRACAEKLDQAQRAFYDAVLTARASGEVYRDIAEAAMMTPEGVRRIIDRERKKRE